MPTLASPKTQTLSLSTTVCYFVSHFDGLLWASHRRARNTTVTGPSYLPVQQRHLQASVVAASWLANGGLTVATPLPSTSPICPVFPSRVTACVTAYIDILPTLDADRRTLFSDSATISISARKRLQCTMRLGPPPLLDLVSGAGQIMAHTQLCHQGLHAINVCWVTVTCSVKHVISWSRR